MTLNDIPAPVGASWIDRWIGAPEDTHRWFNGPSPWPAIPTVDGDELIVHTMGAQRPDGSIVDRTIHFTDHDLGFTIDAARQLAEVLLAAADEAESF